MLGTIGLLFDQPLVRELLVASLGLAYVLATGKNGMYVGGLSRTSILAGFSAYLLLAPNGMTIFGKQRTIYRKPRKHPMETQRVRVPRSLAEAVIALGPPTGEKYVVVGGAGFLGERLIAALVARGERDITCVARSIQPSTLKTFGDQVKIVQIDVRNKEALSQVLKGAKCVFAPASELCYFDWLPTHLQRGGLRNIEIARSLVESCVEAKTSRLIYTGSCTSLFSREATRGDGYRESDPFVTPSNSISAYGLSKAQSEKMVLEANGRNGLATGVIRAFAALIGYKDKTTMETAFERFGAVISCEGNAVDFVDVDDIIYAHFLMEKRLRNGPSDDAAGEAINIGPEEALTWSELANIMNAESRKRLGRRISYIELPQRFLWFAVVWPVDVLAWLLPFDVKKVLGWDWGVLSTSTMLHAIAQPSLNDEWRNVKAKRLLKFDNLMPMSKTIERIIREYQEERVIVT